MTLHDSKRWIIDQRIDLAAILEKVGWQEPEAIDALVTLGIARDDARAFVRFGLRLNSGSGEVLTAYDLDCALDLVDNAQFQRLKPGGAA